MTSPFQMPADGWVMIEPAGEHPNGDIVQVIDQKAINAIVSRFNDDAKAGKLSHGDSVLVDQEHFKNDPDKATTAFGWLTGLQGRKDGIYGQIRWTATGQKAIDGGDYRFFSTEYLRKDMEPLGENRERPLRLDGVTLTNQPNNKGMKPITNRAGVKIPETEPDPAKVIGPVVQWMQKVCIVKNRMMPANRPASRGNTSFQVVWDAAKRFFPEDFNTANEAINHDDVMNGAASARLQVLELTNRLCQAGLSPLAAYLFGQNQFPALFNRLNPMAQCVSNPKKLENSPRILRQAAVKIINQAIQAEINATKHPHSVVFARVMNREPIVGKFASCQITPIDLMMNHPEVWERLQMASE